jgi:hypothetical protein
MPTCGLSRRAGMIPADRRAPPPCAGTSPATVGATPAQAGLPPGTARTPPARAGMSPSTAGGAREPAGIAQGVAGASQKSAGMVQTRAGIIPARQKSSKTLVLAKNGGWTGQRLGFNVGSDESDKQQNCRSIYLLGDWPLVSKRQWPAVRFKDKRVITTEMARGLYFRLTWPADICLLRP